MRTPPLRHNGSSVKPIGTCSLLFYLTKLDGLRELLFIRAGTASARIASAVHCPFFRPNSTSGTFPRTKKRKKRSTLKSTR
jgi:hypothetical protein